MRTACHERWFFSLTVPRMIMRPLSVSFMLVPHSVSPDVDGAIFSEYQYRKAMFLAAQGFQQAALLLPGKYHSALNASGIWSLQEFSRLVSVSLNHGLGHPELTPSSRNLLQAW